jgi:GxxExxY protein
MNADQAELIASDITERVIGVFFAVYNELGAGFVESVYQNAMALALRESGLKVEQQYPLTVSFRGETVGEFRVDLLVEETVVLELKALAQLTPTHEVQLVNYLKATGAPVGLLLNFGRNAQFKRRVLSQSEKIRVNPR